MIIVIIILAVQTAWLSFFNCRLCSLEIISFLSVTVKILDVVLLVIGIIAGFFSNITMAQIIIGISLYIALLGIQQEMFWNMRKRFVAYVCQEAVGADFIPRKVVDGRLIIEVSMKEMSCWAVYVGQEELEIDKKYERMSLALFFNRRGVLKYLCCE